MSANRHFLSVGLWKGDYDDVFEVDHPPSCPLIEICDDPDGFPVTTMGCLVGHLENEMGLEEYFQHADDDPAAAFGRERVTVGRHAIEGWEIQYHNYEHPDEYDSGLRLTGDLS